MSRKPLIAALLTFCAHHAFGAASASAGTRDVVCVRSDLPSGKSDALFLVFDGNDGRLARLSRAPGTTQASLLTKNLKCVSAESDLRVVNCLRPTAPDSIMKSDATFTILHQRTLAAGPIERGADDRGEAITDNYLIYFRDDVAKLEIKWTLGARNCRKATADERAFVLALSPQ